MPRWLGGNLGQAAVALADEALEATVVASWSRLGYQLRERAWSSQPAPAGCMCARNVLVTGGTSGIGRATALALCHAGASVGIVGRDRLRAQRAASEIAARVACAGGPALACGHPRRPPEVWAEPADMASPSQVAELARRVGERLGRPARLDVLVHAAGLIYHRYEASPEGTERTAAVHVAGTHLLTKRLLPLLKAAAPSAVIWVSSGGMYAQRLDLALLGPDPASYNGLRAYALAKRAQSVLAQLWSEHHGADGVLFRVMHPGWVETRAIEAGLPGFARLARPLLRTPEQGADTIVWLATGAACHNPQVGLWFDRRPRSEHRLPGTKTPPGEAAKLWDWCEERANASGPGPLPLSGRPL